LGSLERDNLSHWKGQNRVGVSLHVKTETDPAISSYLEFQAMDKVHKPSGTEWYALSLEPFQNSTISLIATRHNIHVLASVKHVIGKQTNQCDALGRKNQI
jgi:hypothetical protein